MSREKKTRLAMKELRDWCEKHHADICADERFIFIHFREENSFVSENVETVRIDIIDPYISEYQRCEVCMFDEDE